MKKLLFLSFIFISTLPSFAQDGSTDLPFNPGTGADNTVRSISVQTDGKIIIAGLFTTYNGSTSNRIARLNTNGSLDASFNLGTGADNTVLATAIQTDGKIIIGGGFTDYNGTTINRIARLNTDGSLDLSFNPVSGPDAPVFSITIQTDGKIIIGGVFTDYNGTARNNIARLNTDGSLDTSFDPGDGTNNFVSSSNIQTDGKIIIAGAFTSFNTVARNRIARLNADGSLDTSFDPGTGCNNIVRSTSIQPDGKIIVGGDLTQYNGNASFRLARVNTDGSFDTSFNIGTGTNGRVFTTAVQADGKVIIGGEFTTFNSVAHTRILRLNTNGNYDATFSSGGFGSGANGKVWSSAIQTDGKILIGGEFTSHNSNSRVRVARINATSLTGCPGFKTDTRTECDSLIWIDGNTYYANNNSATFTILSGTSNSCDSIVTLDLTINNSNTGTDTQTACDSYTWIDGNTYTSSNSTATHTLTNMVMCDSVVTLNLTINNSNTGIDTQTACDTYTWIDGNIYTSSNSTATHTLTNIAMCDSVVTLNLTINSSNTGTDMQTACDSLIWIDGTTYYTNNNTATFNIIGGASNGCDSLVTLDLTINSISDLTTTTSGTTITANNLIAAYQWLDCGNSNSIIAEETNPSYTPSLNGSYALELTENGCIDTTTCVMIANVGIIETNFGNELILFPNPTSGNFSIDLSSNFKTVKVTITDISGKIIQTRTYNESQLLQFNLESEPGIYFIVIDSDGKKDILRLVKD